jgi:hypothetical protein
VALVFWGWVGVCFLIWGLFWVGFQSHWVSHCVVLGGFEQDFVRLLWFVFLQKKNSGWGAEYYFHFSLEKLLICLDLFLRD